MGRWVWVLSAVLVAVAMAYRGIVLGEQSALEHAIMLLVLLMLIWHDKK